MKKIFKTIVFTILIQTPSFSQEQSDFNFLDFPERAEKYMQVMLKKQLFSGTVLLAHNNEIIFQKAYGLASKRFNIPNEINTKFRIASISKNFTAISILQLMERGMMSLEDNVSKFLPQYPHGTEIKIKHLLSHTSGIKRDIDFTEDKIYSQEELIKMTYTDTLLSPPGEKISYSNCGYVILHSIVEKVSGEKFENYITSNILKPLKMENTGIEYPLIPPTNLADGFGLGTDKNGNLAIVERHAKSLGYSDGVSGIYTTAEDLLKFVNSIGTSDILKPETWQLALKAVFADAKGLTWGLGFNFADYGDTRILTHNGRTTGFKAGYTFLPKEKITVIILSNYSESERGAIGTAFFNMIQNLDYTQPKLYNEITLKDVNLSKYTGKYQADKFSFEISFFNNQLYITSHQDPPSLLLPYGENSFFSKFSDLQVEFNIENNKILSCDWIYNNKKNHAKRINKNIK